jgi:hypothetical protein
LLAALTAQGEAELERIDYFAVDLARGALESFVEAMEGQPDFQRVTPGADGSPLVASLTRLGTPQVNLHLVHADAISFIGGGAGGYDAVIVNELLDDLPGRAFFSDADGRRYELAAAAEEEGERWHITLSAMPTTEPALADMPPATVTATSAENVAVVRGAAEQLVSGGLLLVHDYGFADRYTPLADYAPPPKNVPDFVELTFEPDRDDFPRGFFRLFGNDESRVVQITADVAFAELVEALAPHGRVLVLPHGNAMLARRGSPEDLREDDGVFLSEFVLPGPGDDLEARLEWLERDQAELRRRFADEYLDGARTAFSDLVFVKR